MIDRTGLRQRLDDGLLALAWPLSADARERLLDYLALLERWNATYNLTAIREPLAMVDKHLLDSLAVARLIEGDPVADLGTGPGLPGIPMAIADPDRRVLLVESNGKKARFVREAVRTLGLANAQVVEARAESDAARPVPAVMARALASIRELCGYARNWLADDGRLYAMKGPGVEDELRELPGDFERVAIHEIRVPGLDADRNLVVLRKAPV